MNIYELERLASDWRQLDKVDTWPKSWPKKKRTMAYADKCKSAAHDFERHARRNFMRALEALRSIEKPLQMAADDLRRARLTGTPSYLEIHADSVKKLIAELEEVK